MCYRVETLRYSSSMFRTIDCCYVLTMEGSKRRNEYMHQLRTFKPCRTVHIQHNKGYKKCKKQLCEQNSMYDIGHAVANAFQHARRYKGNIIVFEDDFFFRNDVRTTDVARIEDFVSSHPFDCYSLGLIPFLSYPKTAFHARVLLFGGAHAIIFHPKAREKLLAAIEKDTCAIGHVDGYYSKHFTCYTYYKPLCFQLFPPTPNQDLWGKNMTRIEVVDRVLGKAGVQLTKVLRLDKEALPGFRLAYLVSMLIPILLFMVLLYQIG
jgi:hypothetical protein